jgi:hypothetical protein
MSMPLVLLALFFAVAATVEWDRLPAVARVYVGVATAFAIGAAAHPGMTIGQAMDAPADGITLVLAVARVLGFAAVMCSLATALRARAVR